MNFTVILSVSALTLFLALLYQAIETKKKKRKLKFELKKNQRLENKIHSLEKKHRKIEWELKNRLETQENQHANIISSYSNKVEGLELQLNSQLTRLEELMDLFKKSIDMDSTTIMKVVSFHSDFILASHVIAQKYLLQKQRPARMEAIRIKEVIADSKRYLEAYRLMCYKYEYMLTIFPELTHYLDDFESIRELEELIINPISTENISIYLSKEERKSLPEVERNQLAFDRYLKRRKSNWELGRDYELFCGIELEKDGWSVEYYGIEKKRLDLGRDLIASKGSEILIVQCKYWSKHKVIHEKHIFQLVGSMMEYQISSKNVNVNALFMTSAKLTDTAKKIADIFGIKYIEDKPLSDFPRIKCNINKDEFGHTTKIYHLPFDQQYETTRIQNPGECYAWDVYDAERKGFRRAKRFFMNQ